MVSPEAEEEIRRAIGEVGRDYLKPIKEVVSESISYDEIKLVLAKTAADEEALNTDPEMLAFLKQEISQKEVLL
ncbi:MAG: helix-turn-helix domain-containing protein [Alkalibacterium sp.]|nr:helix-turn-helix domain-containing protein [Alkalibacterium sp.]